ncbi:MAG: caspase family protein [Candidatus Sericytochromatia bacterium]|nr:caspase family protein [Candidatus Sericytochromatia bacterium]
MSKQALLIGIGTFKHSQFGLNKLNSVANDVSAMERVLGNPEIGGFDVKKLIDVDFSLLQEEIAEFFSKSSKEDVKLLYFSGHGILDDNGKLYFAATNTKKEKHLISATTVHSTFVQEKMFECTAKRQIIILDCCFSGAFDPLLNQKGNSAINFQNTLGAEGRVVLTSSSQTQYSFEKEGEALSIYTKYLVQGLESGDGDMNNDGDISIIELHEYAKGKVQEIIPSMTPKIITLKDKGFDICIAKAPIVDPKIKYRRLVEKYAINGDLSVIHKKILNEYRERLGLSFDEIHNIESSVIKPFRKKSDDLEKYKNLFIQLSNEEFPINQKSKVILDDFYKVLGLQKEDVETIEKEIIFSKADFKEKKENSTVIEQIEKSSSNDLLDLDDLGNIGIDGKPLKKKNIFRQYLKKLLNNQKLF